MANSYSAWVKEVLPDADIVYDHFHLIKLMNERMNNLRKSTMNKLAAGQKKELIRANGSCCCAMKGAFHPKLRTTSKGSGSSSRILEPLR